MEAKDLSLFVGRIDATAAATFALSAEITRQDFLHFMTLTPDELDDVCDLLR